MNLVQSIKESCFYRLCAAIAAWCSAQWEKSWIIDRFSSQKSGLAQAEAPASFQFMRVGYFCLDSKDSAPGRLVFNRSVGLKDGFKK